MYVCIINFLDISSTLDPVIISHSLTIDVCVKDRCKQILNFVIQMDFMGAQRVERGL